MPSSIRFVFLASGRPVLVFAADGRNVYLVDPRDPENTYYKVRSAEGRLDRLVSMPLRTADLLCLLAGRTPVAAHSEVLLELNPEGGSRVLVLKNWWAPVEKIYLQADNNSVQQIELLERSGELRYRVEYLQWQTVEDYAVPKKMKISNNDGAALILSLDRYEVTGEPEASMFTIAPPADL